MATYSFLKNIKIRIPLPCLPTIAVEAEINPGLLLDSKYGRGHCLGFGLRVARFAFVGLLKNSQFKLDGVASLVTDPPHDILDGLHDSTTNIKG